jgi:hypothetical protein
VVLSSLALDVFDIVAFVIVSRKNLRTDLSFHTTYVDSVVRAKLIVALC